MRTRAAGGPSTEDIYTGLMSGVRQIQVASNSGVFTVEFDPDFRGSRRYNDKAKRMVERYGSILESVGSNQLYDRTSPASARPAAPSGDRDVPDQDEADRTTTASSSASA